MVNTELAIQRAKRMGHGQSALREGLPVPEPTLKFEGAAAKIDQWLAPATRSRERVARKDRSYELSSREDRWSS